MLWYFSAYIVRLFREANSFPIAKLEKNCSLRRTDNVQGQISSIFVKWNGGYCIYYASNIFRNTRDLFTKSLPSKTFTAYQASLVFSGTALSTSRFISSSVTKANCSPILILILIANLKPSSFGNWGISLGYSPVLAGAYSRAWNCA